MVYLAFGLAIVADLVSVMALLHRLHRHRVQRFRGAFLLPALGAALLAWPCFFLSVVVGGTLGGGYGSLVGARAGLGDTSPLIPVGIALGMWLVFALPELLVILLLGFSVLGPRRVHSAT